MFFFIFIQMKDETMMARIRDAEHAQMVAELAQKVSLLEMKVRCVLKLMVVILSNLRFITKSYLRILNISNLLILEPRNGSRRRIKK